MPPGELSSLARYQRSLLGVFKPALVLARGQGARVWDENGREYLDLLGGIAVNALGHAHPDWVAAIAQQAGRLAHVSNLYTTEPQITLAERLAGLAGADAGGRVFFANSGAEANEAALKAVLRGPGQRILALEGAFHGRTLGALSLTEKAGYRTPYAPFTGPVEFLPFGDLRSLEAAFAAGGVAALVLEAIQGEAGVRPLPPGYLAAARGLASAHGALLWIDEIQTGTWRTGAFLASQNPDLGGPIAPDIVTLAKGLGGGFPIGAMVALNQTAASLLGPGDHGTTFGGNPLAASAALATLDVVERDGLAERAAKLGARWRADLATVPGVKATRGAGLLIGVVLEDARAAEVTRRAQDSGFLVNAPAADVVRLAPPLTLTQAEADSFTGALPELLKGRE